jgi:hypothetical protein
MADTKELKRPESPSMMQFGKRTITAAWPVMAMAQYVDAATAHMDAQDAEIARLEAELAALREKTLRECAEVASQFDEDVYQGEDITKSRVNAILGLMREKGCEG